MSEPENPPAFPIPDQYTPNGDPVVVGCFGMTLRDWFAGQWVSGCLANGAYFSGPESVAREAYGVADAMLAARKDSHDRR